MTIDVYTATGSKKGTATLPKNVFEADINEGLMHQAVVRILSNRRNTVSHTKKRGEIQGSTRKLFQQKGTGRARRGSIRANVLRGGNKAFGPLKNANYEKDMPQKMRRAALVSALSAKAKAGGILGLENYPEKISTKDASAMLQKMPVDLGRKILIVTKQKHAHLALSTGNLQNVSTVMAQYLNPEMVLGAQYIILMEDAIKRIEELGGGETKKAAKKETTTPAKK